jgi:hypothetical protein
VVISRICAQSERHQRRLPIECLKLFVGIGWLLDAPRLGIAIFLDHRAVVTAPRGRSIGVLPPDLTVVTAQDVVPMAFCFAGGDVRVRGDRAETSNTTGNDLGSAIVTSCIGARGSLLGEVCSLGCSLTKLAN